MVADGAWGGELISGTREKIAKNCEKIAENRGNCENCGNIADINSPLYKELLLINGSVFINGSRTILQNYHGVCTAVVQVVQKKKPRSWVRCLRGTTFATSGGFL